MVFIVYKKPMHNNNKQLTARIVLGLSLVTPIFPSSIENTGNIIIGYVKNRERQRQEVTKVAKSRPPSDFGRFSVIISCVSEPKD